MFIRRILLMVCVIAATVPAPEAKVAVPQQRLAPGALPDRVERPFGTLQEQAVLQQDWLQKRLDTFLPTLMRKHGIDMWVVPMREYMEDPIFKAIVSPETFAARRRTIYVFFDKCAATAAPVTVACVERLALGGTTQGGVFETRASDRPTSGAPGNRMAELWGAEQWQLLKQVVDDRQPKVIGINRSTVFAFSDGLTSGEYEGMSEALGAAWTTKFKNAEGLPLELIALRLPEEEVFFEKMNAHVWSLTQTMFSEKVIVPGVTRTSDLVWWFRQRVNDQGLGTWFQPSVSVQRKGVTGAALGADPVIERGDVLHCDVGITVARLNTDTQHNGYVLRQGETDAPAGIKAALTNANIMQDFFMEEARPGRTGNEMLKSILDRMKAAGLNGTMYSHPVGLHGHGAGPLVGLWDMQGGVAGRGDAKLVSSMWYSVEHQVTTRVDEWDGQPVRMAQEEDMIISADGKVRWAYKRQDRLHIVK